MVAIKKNKVLFKLICFFTVILILTILFVGCSAYKKIPSDPNEIQGYFIPDGYYDSYVYDCYEFQYSRIYSEYKYINSEHFMNNQSYHKVAYDEVEFIKEHFSYAYSCSYGFDELYEKDHNFMWYNYEEQVKVGDYVRVYSPDSNDDAFVRYHKFDLYYFDVELNSLFYIHCFG